MLKIGVIGYGFRINNVVRQLVESGEAELAAVTDIADKTEFLEKNGHKGVRQYTDADEMMRNEQLDGVCIATRCSTHAHYMKLVEKYNIPVFLEKPVGINDEDIELLKSIKGMDDRVVVSFPLRGALAVQYVKNLIDIGTIGEVVHVQAYNNVSYGRGYYHGWYRDESVTGGLFLQKATHDLDYINYLLEGRKPVRLCAMTSKMVYKGDKPAGRKCADCPERHTCVESIENIKRNQPEYGGDPYCCFAVDTGNEDSGSVIIEYDNGMHVVYSQDFIVKHDAGKRGARLIGYYGTIEFDFVTSTVTVYKHIERATQRHEIMTHGGHYGGDPRLVENFINVMKGMEKSKTPLSDGIKSAELCLAAKKSASEHRYMDINF